MDIDDILAEVDRGARADAEAAFGPSPGSQQQRDLQALVRAWVNEKGAPELLPWPKGCVDRVMESVRKQIDLVEEQTGNPDPKANFQLVVLQTELERVKFLVRSFLRTRIAKLDRHALHYQREHADRPPGSDGGGGASSLDGDPLLSEAEAQYAARHQALLEAHYRAAFLGSFPAALQRLDDSAGGIAMVERPDADAAVFVRALADQEDTTVVPGTDIELRMRRGEVYVVRWSAVKDAVIRGEAELL